MRREVLVIGLITLVALGALAAFGGALHLKRTNEPAPVGDSWPVTATLPDPVPGGRGWEVALPDAQARELVLHFRVAGSNEPIATYTHLTIRDLTSRILDVKITQGDSLAITPPHGLPVTVDVNARGWLPGTIGPLIRVPGVALSIQVPLARVQPVTFEDGHRWNGGRLTIRPAGPPDDLNPHSFHVSAYMAGGTAAVELAPGEYWAFLHMNYGSNPWGANFPDPVEAVAFSVVNKPGRVSLSGLPMERRRTVSGTVTNEGGEPLANTAVRVEALGPCAITWLETTTVTDAEGRFQAKTTPDFPVRVAVDCAAGRAEAMVVAGQAGKPVPLKLRPWISKARGIFPAEPVGSVQILRRGKPVPGAILRPARFGTFTQSEGNDGRALVLVGVADDNGVIEPLGRSEENYVVYVGSPWSADPFELRYRPGSRARAVYELSPPGTGDLRVRLTGSSADLFTSWSLSSAGRSHDFPHVIGEDDVREFEVCGLKPGVYTLTGSDQQLLRHSCEVTVRADEETVIENPIPIRRVSGTWPRPGFWNATSSLRVAEATNEDNRTLFGWSADASDAPPWPDGFDIKHAPTYAFYLYLSSDGHLVASALVPEGRVDVSDLQWQHVDDPALPRVRLFVQIPKKARLQARPDVSIGFGQSEPMPVSWFAEYHDGVVSLRVILRPGRHRVVVAPSRLEQTSPTFRALDTTIELRAGTPAIITLEPINPPAEAAFVPTRRVLQAALAVPLPRPIVRLDLQQAPRPTMEFHVDVTDLPALWHATVDVPDRLAHWNQSLGEFVRSRPLELRQRQGRPILCFDGEFQPGEVVTLRVPGFAPVEVKWPGGDCAAVHLAR